MDIFKIFAKSKPNPLRDAAIQLPIHHRFVIDLPNVSSQSHLLYRHFACLDVNSNLSQEHAIHVVRNWVALPCIRVTNLGR